MKISATAWLRAQAGRSVWATVLAAGAMVTAAGCDTGGRIGPGAGGSTGTAARSTAPADRVNVPRGVVNGIAGEPEMRVRVMNASSGIAVNSGLRAVWVAGWGDARSAAKMTAPVQVSLDARQWTLTDSAGLTAHFDRTATVELSGEEGVVGAVLGETGKPVVGAVGRGANVGLIRPGSPAITDSAMLSISGKRYGGVIRLSGRSEVSARSFDVVEYVALEDYLKGVVPAEMFANWPLAAYQTQAITARSYAIHERQRARAAGERFDVEASVKDQAYLGGGQGSPLITRAVDSTRGIALTWAGQPLRAYYSSTCGGRPSAARDTWPTGAGFDYNLAGPVQGQIRDHACQQATYYRWTVSRSRGELLQRLRAFGQQSGTPLKGLTGLDSIRQAGVGLSGRPNRFLIMQPGGQTFTVTGEELRRAANTEVGKLLPITAATRVHSSDAEVTILGNMVTFTGRGFGHGVGMCQWCAKGFADKGESYSAIIQRFYPGAKLERVY